MSARRTTGPRVAAGSGPRISAAQPATPPTLVQLGTDHTLVGAREVDVEQLAPDPEQPRKHMQPERLEELAASIARHGILQPLVVREDGLARDGNMRYTIVAGGRRYAAAKLALQRAADEETRARLARVPVVVTATPDAERRVLQLIENLQREDLEPVEEARALKEVMRLENLTTTGLAARVHRSQGYVDERLRLLRHEDVEEAVETGVLTRSAGAAIASIGSADERRQWIERARAGETIRPSEVYASKPNRRRRPTTDRGHVAADENAQAPAAAVATSPTDMDTDMDMGAVDEDARIVTHGRLAPSPAAPAVSTTAQAKVEHATSPGTLPERAATGTPTDRSTLDRPVPNVGSVADMHERGAALAVLGVAVPEVPDRLADGATPDEAVAFARSLLEGATAHEQALVERVLATGALLNWSCEDMLRRLRGGV